MEKANIQGLVLAPYRYRRSRYVLLSLPDGAGNGRGLLKSLLPYITHGETQYTETEPKWLCNVGLTCQGLKRIECDPALIDALDFNFQSGPDPKTLADIQGSPSERKKWWEGQWQTHQIHIGVQLYAREAVDLDEATDLVLRLAAESGWVELLARAVPDGNGSRRLDAMALTRASGDLLPGARVHFGYRDGLSQPAVAWDRPPTGEELDRGHFLLGYSSPTVPSAPSPGPSADFFRDSTYMVLRWLRQDVAAFEKYLTDTAPLLCPERPLAEGREFVAAKLMGRWRNGAPLTLYPDKQPENPDRASLTADFKFKEQDADGMRCPFSAHIRVVNPRDQDLKKFETTGVPRVLRRGMPYGPDWPAGQTEDDGIERGIVGVFLCTDISRQIYTMVQWITMTNFSPSLRDDQLHDQDNLFGNRSVPLASKAWSVPMPDGEKRLTGLPDFVTTKGTAFFLLPSMSTLKLLSE